MKSEVEKDELEIESILVYYVDEKRTTNTTHKLTTATLTVTAMLILGLYVGLLFLVSHVSKMILIYYTAFLLYVGSHACFYLVLLCIINLHSVNLGC